MVDLDSTNGVYVSGERVQERFLEQNDHLGLGNNVVLRVTFRDPAELLLQERVEEAREKAELLEVVELPRGGQLLCWGDFLIQVGIYPETIKDTMALAHGVPQVFVVPEHMFDVSVGVSRAEVEFPVYFNFYLHQRKTTLICRRNQFKPLLRVLREAVFGPSSLQLEQDYPAEAEQPDPKSFTSGFVIWVNGRGILVDPPVDTTRWMVRNGVDSRLIDDLILTHCHADHDAGTLQKLLEEGRIKLHTTPTIIASFVRKYSGLLGLEWEQLRALFDFRPVKIGEPVNIAGANFRFRYNFHTIPTLGFQLTFQERTIAFSGDHLNDPDRLGALAHEQNLFADHRLEDLLAFPWEADLIFHEAGIPPIHTPLETLQSLDQPVKRKLFLNHISADKIPPESGLQLAPPGVGSTLTVKVQPPSTWLVACTKCGLS